MLVDTHGHINMMIKKNFDTPLESNMYPLAHQIMIDAQNRDVSTIINVGTSAIESQNCIDLAKRFDHMYAAVGIHPNDCTETWQSDMIEIQKMLLHKSSYKIVGIGECGMDFHYPNFNKQRQIDAFRMQIELALQHDLALIIHSRDAADETLKVLHEYKNDLKRGVFHCFSYNASIAQEVLKLKFVLGVGGTITYPRNEELRSIVKSISLEQFVLETDAPFLPPQHMRGKQNHPSEIRTIAEYIAQLREIPYEKVAYSTTQNARILFGLPA